MPFEADFRTLALLASVLAVAIAFALVGAASLPRRTTGCGDPSTRGLARAAVVLVAATWVLLVLGSSVRVNGAGLACPDWPACFGEVIPQLDWGVALEFGHRVYAGAVSLGFVALGFAVLRRSALRRTFVPLFGFAAVALGVQIVLGGLTVLHLLEEWTVSSHLLGGNTFSLLMGLIALALRDHTMGVEREPVSTTHRVVATALLALLAAQLVLGGLVSSSHAGLACGTWPTCNGPEWFPTFSGRVGLQVTHRLIAYVVVVGAVAALAVSRGRGRVGRAALAAVGLALAQASLGVANVLLHLRVEVTLLHSAGAAALVLTVGWMNHEAWRAPRAMTTRVGTVRPHRLGEVAGLPSEAK